MTIFVYAGQTSIGLEVGNGGQVQVLNGGTALATVVSSLGTQVVLFGGLVSGTILSGGTELDNGTASATIVYAGGAEVVSAGGTTIGLTISSGGQARVSAGGTASGVTIDLSAGEVVFSGAATSGTTVNNGGTEDVYGTASTTTVSGGGFEYVYAAGRTSGTTLSGASFEFVYSGGSAIGTIVSSGGREIVSGTGVGTGTVVHDGGYAIVSGGGTLAGTVVNSGGSEWVDAGGSANLTVLGSGGTETVQAGGSASATTVNNSGTEWVQAGGSASATTVNGGGTQDVNDGTATATTVSSGGVLEVSLAAVVNGAHLAKGSVVDFSDVAFDPSGTASVDPTTHLLTLSAGGVSQSIGVDPAQSFGGAAFSRADDGLGGTDVTAPCFRAGTLIRTDRGEVPVEALRIGDRVASAFGGVVRVRWLGHRHIDCKRHPRPHDVWPVRVATGAFGADRPCRELWLSPDHAVFIDGVLIPVRYLLNDATIRQDSVGQVSYWHVELPLHDVLFAEGMAVESYLDTGNRGAFANGGGGTMLHADFARRVWEAESCAPLVHDGAELAAVRGALHERAEALGYAITREADLRFVVDGSAVRSHVEGRTHRFHLPGAASAGRLLSRSAVPAFVGADSDDHRRLGVAVSRIVLDGRAIGLDDPRLGAGWQVDAPDAACGHWRWTNGDAALEVAGVRLLEVEVAITARYWLADGRAEALAA